MSLPTMFDPLERLLPASRMTRRQIEWLWQFRLGLGKLAMLDGDPEQGKSLVALDLCARLSTGRPMPDGSPGISVANSLILQEEDGTDDTVLARLATLGADLDHVFPWNPHDETDMPLRLPANIDLLEQAIVRTDARLVVIDPVMAFLDRSIMVNNDQSVRRALAPLARLARIHRCVVLLVRHLNKQGGFHALYRGGGSIGLLAACRSGWLIGRDPHVPERRILAQVKNNLAGPQPSLAYELLPQPDGPPTLAWLGESPLSAGHLLTAAAKAPAPQRDRAETFLKSFLKDGPRPSREIWAAAQKEHISARTIRRAKKALDLRCQRVVHDDVQQTYWRMNGQFVADPTNDAFNSIMQHLAEQERKFPPACPIDDEWTDRDMR